MHPHELEHGVPVSGVRNKAPWGPKADVIGYTRKGMPVFGIAGGATGTIQVDDFTGGVRPLNVEDMIYLLTPSDVPLQGTYNDPNAEIPPRGPQLSVLNFDTADQIKVEWIEDELLTARGTLNEALDDSETGVDVQAGEGKNFAIGHVIRVDDEFMRVTAIATDTLTVTRGFGDSSAATHADDADVVGVGTALAEGSDPGDAKWVDPSGLFNITEIFGPYKVDVSGTEQVVRKYGIGTDTKSYQVQKRVREIAIEIEQAILYGQREHDTTNNWRTMGGLAHYITTNKDATTTTLDESSLTDQLQGAYDNGGVIDILIAGGRQIRNISAFSQGLIRIARDDRVRGQVVNTIMTDFGDAATLLDRHCRAQDVFGVDSKYLTLTTLRPLQVEPLAKTGDSEEEQVLCEKTLKVRMQARHLWFNNLS